MPDYGHELKFGTFITPQVQSVDGVVALAQLTEAAGLDLVTFQDHPYNPQLLDTWTLLSFVAAKTERIALSGNVLNLPLRPPAVLARAAASLDLLSGGRVELGLGAGAFWDGIAAMGGRKLTPGEGVDALSEAIDIIRALWDTSERGGVRLAGQFHGLEGARRGPLPAHRISIWLGAYKPRMLKLVGSKADGWLPSQGYLKPGDIAAGNAAIDQAALDAGRDPREIRRLINIAGLKTGADDEWRALTNEVTRLALEDGFSTFILPADQAMLIERFGGEVAPAVREAVSKARRASGTTAGPVRSAAAIKLRRPGVDYDRLPARLAGKAVEPGDHGYSALRSTYVHKGAPGLIIMAEDGDDVAAAVDYARGHQVPLAVRSGGHGISGRSTNDGGILLDVSKLNAVTLLDPARKRVRIGAGARWGVVAEALAPHGLGMSSGDYGDVGVGGLATAGGIGWLSRKHGLTIDHVVAADMVLVDGRQVRVDAEHHPDLFWALRGAGGNFGVVTAFELDAYDVGNVVFAQLTYDLSDARSALPRWADAVVRSPRALTSFLTMGPGQGGSAPFGQASIVIADAEVERAQAMLQPFLDIAPILGSQAYVIPYKGLVESHFTGHDGQGGMTTHNGLLTELTPEIAAGMHDILRAGATNMMQLRAVGGAVNDVAPDATAYAHRHQNFNLSAVGYGQTAKRLEALWPAVEQHLDGLYLSFDTRTGRDVLERAFPGATLSRLQALKAEYDPDELFNANFPIPPLRPAAE